MSQKVRERDEERSKNSVLAEAEKNGNAVDKDGDSEKPSILDSPTGHKKQTKTPKHRKHSRRLARKFEKFKPTAVYTYLHDKKCTSYKNFFAEKNVNTDDLNIEIKVCESDVEVWKIYFTVLTTILISVIIGKDIWYLIPHAVWNITVNDHLLELHWPNLIDKFSWDKGFEYVFSLAFIAMAILESMLWSFMTVAFFYAYGISIGFINWNYKMKSLLILKSSNESDAGGSIEK